MLWVLWHTGAITQEFLGAQAKIQSHDQLVTNFEPCDHLHNSFHIPQSIIVMTPFEQGSQITVFLEKIQVK